MTRQARISTPQSPRFLTDAATARLLGVSASTFSRKARKLEAAGLPPKVPDLGRDKVAVLAWLGQAIGSAEKTSTVAERVGERMRAVFGNG